MLLFCHITGVYLKKYFKIQFSFIRIWMVAHHKCSKQVRWCLCWKQKIKKLNITKYFKAGLSVVLEIKEQCQKITCFYSTKMVLRDDFSILLIQ